MNNDLLNLNLTHQYIVISVTYSMTIGTLKSRSENYLTAISRLFFLIIITFEILYTYKFFWF